MQKNVSRLVIINEGGPETGHTSSSEKTVKILET